MLLQKNDFQKSLDDETYAQLRNEIEIPELKHYKITPVYDKQQKHRAIA